MSITLTDSQYEKLRLAAAGYTDWITEEELKRLTGWSRETIRKKRYAGALKYRTISGKKIQYSRSQVEKMFIVIN
jgi:hypothetical protein